MSSITTNFLKQRQSTPALGQWSSGFSQVKSFADKHGVPAIMFWTNGDACNHCCWWEKSMMQAVFKNWMKSSKCAFWCGSSLDSSNDDKFQGKGFQWMTQRLETYGYPFACVWWKKGGLDFGKYESWWGVKDEKSGSRLVSKFKSVLKKYTPDPEPEPPTPEPDPEEPPIVEPEPDAPEEIPLSGEDGKALKLSGNRIIRTYQKGESVQFTLPRTDRTWTVQVSNNVRSAQIAGGTAQDNAALRIQDAAAFGDRLSCLDVECFKNCGELRQLYMPPSIRRINDRCFEGCAKLRTVSYNAYDKTAADEDSAPALEYVGGRAFAGCGGVQQLVLPESISSLDQLDPQALAGSSITSLTLLGLTAKQLTGG